MKFTVGYWGIISILGIIHLHFFLLNLPVNVPFALTALLVLGSLYYYFYKGKPLQIASLKFNWNRLLLCLQLLIPIHYIGMEQSWLYAVPLSAFIIIEVVRLSVSQIMARMQSDLKEVEKQQDHMNETFRIIRSERHDFLKHASVIHFLLEKEQFLEAKAYLDELIVSYDETNLAIKGERGIVAALLHQTYRYGQEKGMIINYDLDIPLSTIPLSNKDIISLLGNLLANSSEACEEWQQKYQRQASLTLQFYKRGGLYILICKNSCPPIPAAILDQLFHSHGATTKTGNHQGLGTKIIVDIVEKNKGMLDFVYKKEEFTVKIKLPSIR